MSPGGKDGGSGGCRLGELSLCTERSTTLLQSVGFPSEGRYGLILAKIFAASLLSGVDSPGIPTSKGIGEGGASFTTLALAFLVRMLRSIGDSGGLATPFPFERADSRMEGIGVASTEDVELA